MKIRLRDKSEFNIQSPKEDLIIYADGRSGWSFKFVVADDADSDTIERAFSPENISEIELISGENKKVLTGYGRLSSATVIFSENTLSTICHIQLTKTGEA